MRVATYPKRALSPNERASFGASILLALPLLTCILLPLPQIGNLVYLYDLVTAAVVAQFMLNSKLGSDRRGIVGLFAMFGAAAVVSFLAGMFWTGPSLRPLQILTQNVLAVLYALCVYLAISSGGANLRVVAACFVYGALAQSFILVAQGIGFRVAPDLTFQVYKAYLDFSGFDSRFYETKFVAEVANNGYARVMGTWDISTTASGMVAALLLPIVLLQWKLWWKLAAVSFVALALFETGSRHSWILVALVFLAIIVVSLRSLLVLIPVVIAGAVIVALSLSDIGGTEIEDGSTDQFRLRVQRTLDQGVEDSSLQLRYVVGTQRFVNGVAANPSIALFGFGAATEKTLWESLGPVAFESAAFESYQWGFVSNSWLQVIRNFGILGFLSWAGLVGGIFKARAPYSNLAGWFMIVLIGSDNYAAEVQRCILIILAVMAIMLVRGNRKEQFGKQTP